MGENVIKQACKELNTTQKELAEKMGVAEQTIRNWSSKGNLPDWAKNFINILIENNNIKIQNETNSTQKVLKEFKNLLENI